MASLACMALAKELNWTTYAGQQPAKGTGRIVLPRVQLDVPSLSLRLMASLLELLRGLIADLHSLVLRIVDDRPGAVELRAGEIRRRLAGPGIRFRHRAVEGALKGVAPREERRHGVWCVRIGNRKRAAEEESAIADERA